MLDFWFQNDGISFHFLFKIFPSPNWHVVCSSVGIKQPPSFFFLHFIVEEFKLPDIETPLGYEIE